MLPDIDGFRICQKIRENYYFPVIMLTAKIDDGDKIMGLTIGADDYITKPFNPLEVIARVKTQLRRYQKYNNPTKKQFFPKSEYDISILISFFLVQGMGLFLPVDSPVAALEYPILSAVVAVITSVVVALLGGLLPALKAAKLEPALALR